MADNRRSELAPGTASDPLVTSISILTYKRPDELKRAIESLGQVALDGGTAGATWTIAEVLIIDNEREAGAREGIEALQALCPLPVRYHHEPTPGLAAPRNRALDEAVGRVLVFLDDDETAEQGWPGELLNTMLATGAGLVGGPVRSAFVEPPPAHLVPLFDRPEPPDHSRQSWLRSGNLAIDIEQVGRVGVRFDEAFAFTGGEDVAFSRAAAAAGIELRWAAGAPVTEHVEPSRVSLDWLTSRHRRATASWVRVELHYDGSAKRRVLVASRATVRALQGVALTGAGLLARRPGLAATGRLRIAVALGSFDGLRNRIEPGYG